MKEIPGYEGLYAITKNAKVWSLPRKITCWNGYKMITYIRPPQEIKSFDGSCGYKTLILRKNNKSHNELLHRLMGYTYLNLSADQDINHKDGNKLNNLLFNLEVCSRKENLAHAKKMGRGTPYKKGEKHHANKSFLKDKAKIEKEIEKGTHYQKICSTFNLSESRFYDIKNKKHWWYRDE